MKFTKIYRIIKRIDYIIFKLLSKNNYSIIVAMGNKSLFNVLNEKILILDGAMGTMLQKFNLTEIDYRGERFKNSSIELKGNNDLLSITKPEVIKQINEQFLQAGADIIETNTFSANAISQSDYNLQNLVQEMNIESVKIAKEMALKYSTPEKPRFVAGSIGPTNKTASISPDIVNPAYRDVTFDDLSKAYKEQIEIFVKYSVDILLIETIFDTLNAKAAIYAAKEILKELDKEIPIIISVTLSDKSARTLSGQTLEAFYNSIEFANPLAVGMNCSLGIQDMIPYVEEFDKYNKFYTSIYANAGLPNAFGEYDQTPEIMAKGYKYLAKNGLINICGGCCGTTPEHINAIYNATKEFEPRKLPNIKPVQKYSGLEPFKYDGTQNFIVVAERTNVAGSKKFADLIRAKKYQEALEIAQSQIENGANIIDINMDADLIEAKEAMCEFLNLIASEPDIAKVPIMIDSSKFEVVESALKCVQGKSIVNSINLKEGEEQFKEQAQKIKDLGASMIVMAFDEKGQADSIERRIEIVDRAYNILVNEVKVAPEDIIFDLNVFPVATGIKEHDKNAVDFIEATRIITKKYPKVMISGGISNLSFSFRGMNKIRSAMHCVFLYHAINAGMKMGIVNPSTLEIYDDIDETLKTLVEDVVLNRTEDATQKLLDYAQNIQNDTSEKIEKVDLWRNKPVEIRIQTALIKGTNKYLKEDLTEALKSYSPIDIIEKIFIDGMNKVGELFAEGKMFLPQVVKSSRIIKEGVDFLQGYFNSDDKASKIGKIVIATVKGDVHDIGKNILALILKCNNFEVIDLGVMVNVTEILNASLEHNPDIIALSGLITPSLDEMITDVIAIEKEGINVPAIMIGGATTSKLHTALKIAPNYNGIVVQSDNASEAVVIAKKLVSNDNEFINKIKLEQRELVEKYEESLK